jgi:transcriptional regulator with XRE-family HTH domain
VSSQARDISSPVAANLAAEMKRHGLTKTATGELLGVSRRQITRWLHGHHEPRYEFVTAMARAFDREPEWFYVERELEQAA